MLPRLGAALLATLLLVGCSGSGSGSASDPDAASELDAAATDADAGADLPDLRSWYTLTVTLPNQPPLLLERDLTGIEADKFSFGGTHLPPPTRSFAVQDDFNSPAFVILTFNFGVVRKGPDHPVNVGATGSYPFSAAPPEIQLVLESQTFWSGVQTATGPSASGSIVVTDWSDQQGGVFAGSAKGTLLQKTDKPQKEHVDIEGEFHFVLPAPQGSTGP